MDYERLIIRSPGRVQRGGFTVAAMLCFSSLGPLTYYAIGRRGEGFVKIRFCIIGGGGAQGAST